MSRERRADHVSAVRHALRRSRGPGVPSSVPVACALGRLRCPYCAYEVPAPTALTRALERALGRLTGRRRLADASTSIEEVLERLWTLARAGIRARPALGGRGVRLRCRPRRRRSDAPRLGRGPRRIALELTAAGDERAPAVIRRHRLAERLLFDVIHVDAVAMEAGACELEHAHVLSDEATDRSAPSSAIRRPARTTGRFRAAAAARSSAPRCGRW